MSLIDEVAACTPEHCGSRTVRVLLEVDAERRMSIGARDGILASIEIACVVGGIVLDDSRANRVQDLSDYAQSILNVLSAHIDPEALSEVNSEQVSRIAKRLQSGSYQRSVRRLLGAAFTNRLLAAAKHDSAEFILMVRRGLRAALPLAVAWGDLLELVPSNKRKAFLEEHALPDRVFDILFELDQAVDQRAIPTLPLHKVATRPNDLQPITPTDVDSLIEHTRELVDYRSLQELGRSYSRLTRKIQGAKQALKDSPDGLSQAANSLIELIDYIARHDYSESQVLAWIHSTIPDQPDMTHKHLDKTRPTKRAQILCFLYAAGPIGNNESSPAKPSLFHLLLTDAVINARDRLQRFKHGDLEDTPQDRRELEGILTGVQGLLLFVLQLRWLIAPVILADYLAAA